MRTFKEYLAEVKYDPNTEKENASKSEARHTHSIDGWTVRTRNHAASQAFLRRPEFKKDDWKDLHSKVINHIKNNGTPDGEHIFYSGKKRQGYVAEVNHKIKQLAVITTLDPGVSRAARSNTQKHIVESEFFNVIILD